jgi:hypothetical protein
MKIEAVSEFDHAVYLQQKGVAVGDEFHFWDGGDLKKLFQSFQTECTIEFHRWNRRRRWRDTCGSRLSW